VEIRVLCWNLYHGRDGPPDPRLYTRRAEWTRRTERNDTHVQVNRDLYPEFSKMICESAWDVALLQEFPPRWLRPLSRDCGAEAYRSLTSRNWLLPITSLLARHNPDLIGSAEGGSERRRMAFAALGCGLCVTSLHASTRTRLAESELLRAAERALGWASGRPLLLGGDFNLRPDRSAVFAALAERHGLRGATAPNAIDHLLTQSVEIVEGPRWWEPHEHELQEDGRALTLSDHAPVELLLRIA
jgi:hypothetical protein